MKVLTDKAEKREGFNHIRVELNEYDVIILNQALKTFTQYDKDDRKYIKRLDELKDEMHKAFTIVRPS